MSNDNLEFDKDGSDQKPLRSSINESAADKDSAAHLSDREVPLDGRYDKVWRKINADTERMRVRTAPAEMGARIMAALPDDLYVSNSPGNKIVNWITKWFRAEPQQSRS